MRSPIPSAPEGPDLKDACFSDIIIKDLLLSLIIRKIKNLYAACGV